MEEIFSVSTLTEKIKRKLESSFLLVRVQGEVSNLKHQSSGHFYFTLKDTNSQISAVLFKGYAKNLTRPLKNGDEIIIEGEVQVYSPRGVYQLITRKVEFTGVGGLLLKLHAMKTKLQSLGWFNKENKKPIPPFPKTIGVITSPTGAVIQDILHILERRLKHFHLVLYPVKVQGEGAAEEIARAIAAYNRYKLADVLIVGRGGGSLEDLWAFNEEIVATAIHNSHIPIISAVGHETDFSIADFVADLRAPTPSAAAELVSSERARDLQFLKQTKARLTNTLSMRLKHAKDKLTQLKRHPLLYRPQALLEPHFQRLDDFSSKIDSTILSCMKEHQLQLNSLSAQLCTLKPDTQIRNSRQKLLFLSSALQKSCSQLLETKRQTLRPHLLKRQLESTLVQKLTTNKRKLKQIASHLNGIRPEHLLKKGYCILFRENTPCVILSSNEIKKEEKLRLKMNDGQALVTVNEIHS